MASNIIARLAGLLGISPARLETEGVGVSPAGVVSVGARTTLRRYVSNAQIVDKLLETARIEGGNVISTYILPGTPMKTGALRETIRVVVTLEGRTIIMTFLAGDVGDVFYAQFLELPWYARRIKNFTTPGTRAPFLLPGVEEALPYLKSKFGEAIRTA